MSQAGEEFGNFLIDSLKEKSSLFSQYPASSAPASNSRFRPCRIGATGSARTFAIGDRTRPGKRPRGSTTCIFPIEEQTISVGLGSVVRCRYNSFCRTSTSTRSKRVASFPRSSPREQDLPERGRKPQVQPTGDEHRDRPDQGASWGLTVSDISTVIQSAFPAGASRISP